jgi:hypothetical protein
MNVLHMNRVTQNSPGQMLHARVDVEYQQHITRVITYRLPKPKLHARGFRCVGLPSFLRKRSGEKTSGFGYI